MCTICSSSVNEMPYFRNWIRWNTHLLSVLVCCLIHFTSLVCFFPLPHSCVCTNPLNGQDMNLSTGARFACGISFQPRHQAQSTSRSSLGSADTIWLWLLHLLWTSSCMHSPLAPPVPTCFMPKLSIGIVFRGR